MVTATGRLQGLLIPQPVSKRSSMIGVGGETYSITPRSIVHMGADTVARRWTWPGMENAEEIDWEPPWPG